MDTRRTFHSQLDEIRNDLVRLAASVCETIPRGTNVLLDGDLGEAQAVVRGDEEINALALDIEDRCYHLLALQGPMAGDLRAVVTAIRLVAEIERSGDLMVNVAKTTRRIHSQLSDAKVRGFIQTMSEVALRIYRAAMDAYVDADEAKAMSIPGMDDELDRLHKDFITQVLDSCRAGTIDVEAAVQLGLVGRYYERIGDHAVNISERVRYMVSGWMPERPGDRDPQ